MAKQLTAASVQKLTPGNSRREIPDGGCPGLYLIIQARPSGYKSFALRFRRPSGKTAKLTLGPVSLVSGENAAAPVIGAPLTLAAARRLATDTMHQQASGEDVVAVRHRAKLERAVQGAKTFGQAAIDFVDQHARRYTRRWKETAANLGVDDELEIIPKSLADRWRDRAIAAIDGDDIHHIIEEAREKNIPGRAKGTKGPSENRARKMHSALSVMFGWLLKKRRVKLNPCAGVHRPATPKPRDRVLVNVKNPDPQKHDYSELILFWRAADKANRPFATLLKLLLLTGCRLKEVAGMEWTELSRDRSTWTIPGSRTKNKREHVVFLPPLAQELIAAGNSVFVFTTTGTTPVSGWSKTKKKLNAAMLEIARQDDPKATIKPWRLHDLRRTMATGMGAIGIMPHVVEACLNHISGSKKGDAGTYNWAEYAAEQKAAWERWASHVDGLVGPQKKAKVLPLRRAK